MRASLRFILVAVMVALASCFHPTVSFRPSPRISTATAAASRIGTASIRIPAVTSTTWRKLHMDKQTTHATTHATTTTQLYQSSSSSPSSNDQDDLYFNAKTTVALVSGQSSLVLLAMGIAKLVGVPNLGLGTSIAFDGAAVQAAVLATLPLVGLAAALDVIEDKVPALQDVTKATHRSVLSLLGGTWKPWLGLATATLLGLAAGFGEEMLFRGILQYELLSRTTSSALAVGASSLLFGALHAVTPLYAALATLASVYFGALYLSTGNLAVPILCHALYDVGALLFAHWTVSRMDDNEQKAIANWNGPSAGPL